LMIQFEPTAYLILLLLIFSSKFQFLISDLHQMKSLKNYFRFFHQYFNFR